MPFDISDYDGRSDQQLILDHYLRPAYYLTPLLVASMLDSLLFGIILTETWSYLRWFRDGVKFKGLVAALFILNLAQTTMAWYTVFSIFGSGFAQWEGTTTNVYFEGILILEAITGATAQAFFLERAYTLMKKRAILSKVLLAFVIPGIFAGLACGLACGAITVLSSAGSGTDFANFDVLTNLIIGWKGTTVLTDLTLTATIVISLLASRTGWRKTDGAVTRLVRWIVEAQALPLIAALFFLASYAADSGGNVCLIPSFAEAKLACISVLHVLNSRGRMRHDLSTEHTSHKNSGGNELTTKGRVQIQTTTQTVTGPPDDYDLEARGNRPNKTQVQGHNIEDGDDISLESFEGKETRESSRRGPSGESTREDQLSAMSDSRAKLVNVVPFEQMKW